SSRLGFLILLITFCASPVLAQASEPADKENEVLAILWQQSSGEHRALCYQAYALARMLLDRDLHNHRIRMRRAMILDLDETVWMRDDPAVESKTARRKAIGAKYHVVLLMGDDLNDFDEVFEKSKTIASRIEATDRNRSQFGTHFIVLPNPMYGNWANSLYEYNFKLTEHQKAEKRRGLLKD